MQRTTGIIWIVHILVCSNFLTLENILLTSITLVKSGNNFSFPFFIILIPNPRSFLNSHVLNFKNTVKPASYNRPKILMFCKKVLFKIGISRTLGLNFSFLEIILAASITFAISTSCGHLVVHVSQEAQSHIVLLLSTSCFIPSRAA